MRRVFKVREFDRWFFVFGFEKAERSNISAKELAALKLLASDLLERSNDELDALVSRQSLTEICHEEGKQEQKGPA
jgi:hypothetical protein